MTVRAARRIPNLDPGSPAARLFKRVSIDPDGCWLWTGTTNQAGYGQMSVDGVLQVVHRISYEALIGPVPEGHELDHVRTRGCIHRNCVRPDHLDPVGHRENVLRGTSPSALPHNSGRCQRGHDWAIHSVPNGRTRTCGACKQERRAA